MALRSTLRKINKGLISVSLLGALFCGVTGWRLLQLQQLPADKPQLSARQWCDGRQERVFEF
jgi:hypothetical protein